MASELHKCVKLFSDSNRISKVKQDFWFSWCLGLSVSLLSPLSSSSRETMAAGDQTCFQVPFFPSQVKVESISTTYTCMYRSLHIPWHNCSLCSENKSHTCCTNRLSDCVSIKAVLVTLSFSHTHTNTHTHTRKLCRRKNQV